jgi:hypothetical protein
MSTPDLIPVQKDGATLEVHPSTLAAHEAAGWAVCEPVETADEPKPKAQKKDKAKA